MTDRLPDPSCSIPVPYVKCPLVLSAVVNRFVDPSTILSVSNSVKSIDISPVVSLIPVPYVKCDLVLAAVVKRLDDPSTILSLSNSENANASV